MIKWVYSQLQEEKIEAPIDFGNGWQDGKALAHLLHSIKQDSIDLAINTTNQQLIDQVLWSSFQLGIPSLLTKDDILNGADSKAMTTWLSYFKQAKDDNFPQAMQQQAKYQFLLNWINWMLPDVQISNFKQLLTIPVQSFKTVLVKALHLNDIENVEGNTIKELIANSINNYGLIIRDCTIKDVQNGNLFALNHYVTRLMKQCYKSPDNDQDDILQRINRHITEPITDVSNEWSSGNVLIKLASNLSSKDEINDDTQVALDKLETILQLPQIMDINMISQLSLSTVSNYIRMIDYHWNLYLQNKLEQTVDEKYVNAWITWSRYELNKEIGNISSLMSMDYLPQLVKACLPSHYELDEKFQDDDQRMEFLNYIINEFNIDINNHEIQDVVNYKWEACQALLESLFRMRYNLPMDDKELEKILISFFHSKIALYHIFDLKNAWKSQQLIIGLYHGLSPQDSIEINGINAMKKINDILGIPSIINLSNQKFTQITAKLRNMYLSLIMAQMMNKNIHINVNRNTKALIVWAQWALHNDKIQDGTLFLSKQEIVDDLKKAIECYQEQNSHLTIDEEQDVFKHFESQTKCHSSNINDICDWINKFIGNELGEQLHLNGIFDLRDAWNKGVLVQLLSTAINPIFLNNDQSLPSISTYYNGILWSLNVPDIIQYTDCDDLIYESMSSIIAFIALIKTQIQKHEFYSNSLVSWLNAEIFKESNIIITNDLQSMANPIRFRQLCAECLRCEIESQAFADILREIFLEKQLIPLESKETILQITNGNITAKKDLLFTLFSKYNGHIDSKYQTFINENLASFNWPEIEEKCNGDENIIKELKAEQLLKQINKLLVPSDVIVPDDINPMVAVENIATCLKISHNIVSNDIDIDNFGFKAFIIQVQKKLDDVRNEWLLNWINKLLTKHQAPTIDDLDEVLLNPSTLNALHNIIFTKTSNNEPLAELEAILLDTIKKLESSKICRISQVLRNDIMDPAQFAWKLFKYYHQIHISDQNLKGLYTKFVTEHQIISGSNLKWDNCEMIRYIAKQASMISHRKSVKEQGRVSLDTMNNELPISMICKTMDIPIFMEGDKIQLYSDLCKYCVVYLSSQYLFNINPNEFIINWINWLLKTDDKDITNINVLNDLLLLKSRISQTGTTYQKQTTLKEIINELCDTKQFDYDSFEIDKLLKNDKTNVGEFGWSLFQYFYDITDEEYHWALLCDYFQNDEIKDMFGKNFENGTSIKFIALHYAKSNNHTQILDDEHNTFQKCLDYLQETFDLPSLFNLEKCNGNLKCVPFRARLAFFTILRLIMIQKLNEEEYEQKQEELIDETKGNNNGFELGQFVEFRPNDESKFAGVLVAYNSHAKFWDVKALNGGKGDSGGNVFRFIDETQLLQWVDTKPIRIGDDDCYVDCGDFNVKCIVDGLSDEGLVMIEVLESQVANKLKMNGQRLKVPFHHISKEEKPYFTKDENDREKFKDYLRELLTESNNVQFNDEMVENNLENLKKYQKDNFISEEMKNDALNDVLNEFKEKRKLDINSKYVDDLDKIMENISRLMDNKRNVEVSFTISTGKSKGGDKRQIDINIAGPIVHSSSKNVKCYKLRDENIDDLGDGRYKIKFIGTGIGLYNIRVIMFGKESPLSPFQFMMKEHGGEWLQTNDKGKMTAVKSDTMIAKSTDIVSLKQRQKRLKKAQKYTQETTKKILQDLMKLPESSPDILKEIEIIMQKYVEFDKQRNEISEKQKTNEMKEMELKLEEEHKKIILSTFKRTMNYPGHILTKYPNSRFAKAHTRRVKIAQIESNILNSIFFWTESKMCYVKNIRSIKSGKTSSRPWKYCDVEQERCFEMDANGKILCFHCANMYERDFIVKGFQILMNLIK